MVVFPEHWGPTVMYNVPLGCCSSCSVYGAIVVVDAFVVAGVVVVASAAVTSHVGDDEDVKQRGFLLTGHELDWVSLSESSVVVPPFR